MFQKFALAFKSKTFELFSDDPTTSFDDGSGGGGLLDSADHFIPDQKVIILKPDHLQQKQQQQQQQQQKEQEEESCSSSSSCNKKTSEYVGPLNVEATRSLLFSIFSTITSFEASYLQLQTAHVPFNEESIRLADESLVTHLKKLSDYKRLFLDLHKDPDFSLGSVLESEVEENQSKLRVLGTVSDHLQLEIDRKDGEVSQLKKRLSELERSNSGMAKRLSAGLKNSGLRNCEVLLSVRVFCSVLGDACRDIRRFSKVLIGLMRKAEWDLDLAVNSVYSGVDYSKIGDCKYVFFSYVCLGMFQGFDHCAFGLTECEGDDSWCNGGVSGSVKMKNGSMKQLLEHASSVPLELLRSNPDCGFSRFCEKKYQELIHPSMESSIFSNLDKNEVVLNSWRSLGLFYEAFAKMASSIWTLHKLAFSFDPVVEIFRVEQGVDFSMVYMEDVTRSFNLIAPKSRVKVGFTVVPGFKIGKTIIQSQVYLTGLKCTE